MFNLLLLITLFLVALIFFQSKFLLLVDTPYGQSHKSLYNKNTPLSGGIYLFVTIITYINFQEFNSYTVSIGAFLLSLLILGIFSDIKTNFSPKLRLLYQFIIVLIFIFLIDLRINQTGVFFLDFFINNFLFNLLFTTICIVIVINGSNFCDGVNCNVIGYYLVVIIGIYLSQLSTPENLPNSEIIIKIFVIFFCANLLQKSFLGDNGTYVISGFMSIYIIDFINMNNSISPLLALNLLWYPAFENLFTIMRRIFYKKKVQVADRAHLHILILEKISRNKNLVFYNSIAGIFLNIFVLLGILLSINFSNNGKFLISILTVNILIYIFSYYFLLPKRGVLKVDNK